MSHKQLTIRIVTLCFFFDCVIFRFPLVRQHFTAKLSALRAKETNSFTTHSIISLLMGMKFFRVKVRPMLYAIRLTAALSTHNSCMNLSSLLKFDSAISYRGARGSRFFAMDVLNIKIIVCFEAVSCEEAMLTLEFACHNRM